MGVIPTGISLYKNGASKGSSVSFLISTPQTGVDSIMITYSLLGLPFAILRPIIALITGFVGGLLTNIFDKKNAVHIENNQLQGKAIDKKHNVIFRIFKYAFVDFLEDIAKWLIIGLIVAALISVVIPDDFFTIYFKNSYLNMLIMLIASIPLYVCATASVPIAAVLLLKGISPGAALVFLMAGPATNAATITVISRVFGKKNLFIYLFSIITCALLFGTLINEFLPWDLFINNISDHISGHSEHEILPLWLKTASSIILLLLIMNVYFQKYLRNKKIRPIKSEDSKKHKNNLEEITVIVKGMTCNNCKKSVETNINTIQGVNDTHADLKNSHVTIKCKNIDLDKIKNIVEDLGYKYEGRFDD